MAVYLQCLNAMMFFFPNHHVKHLKDIPGEPGSPLGPGAPMSTSWQHCSISPVDTNTPVFNPMEPCSMEGEGCILTQNLKIPGFIPVSDLEGLVVQEALGPQDVPDLL